MATAQKVLLENLQISDIQNQLQKRNLDRTGGKSILVERLKKALISEGKDPNTFRFDMESKKTASALNTANEDELLGKDDEVTDSDTFANGRSLHDGSDANANQLQAQEVSRFGDNSLQDAGEEGKRNAIARKDSVTSSTPKSKAGISTPAKGKKNQSAKQCEGGDDSFVVQEDDIVLNDIDSDLLDGEGKVLSAGSVEEAGDINGDANKGDLGSTATTDDSANLLENTHNCQPAAGDKDEVTKSEAKSSAQSVKAEEKTSQVGRNLWVSGLYSSTRATDLKTLFSKHGKVVAAKVVMNARSAGSRCFGLVTLSSADDATKCVQQLHNTSFRGRKISIERAKTEIQGTKEKILPPSGLQSSTKSSDAKQDEKRSRTSLDNSGDKDKQEAKIKTDDERDRLRRKEQFLEREKFKQRMIERKQREEAFKIERERRRLREMREELERQQMETERLRLETERMQMEKEKEKYRRQQQRAMQDRRAPKRRGPREDEWPNKHSVPERYHQGEGDARDFNRGEERRRFREERPPPRTGRITREDRHPRDLSTRGPHRQDSRSEWKSNRGTWNGPVDNSKHSEWDSGNMGQEESWDSGMVISQPGGSFALQHGQMVGAGTVFIAQPAIQASSVMMQSGMSRQSDGRFGMAAASVRRY